MTNPAYVKEIIDIENVANDPVSAKKLTAGQKIRKGALGLSILALTVAALGFGHHYFTVGQYLESTDDAYVKADTTLIAPKVSGYINEVLVRDNQKVKAGQVLARLDDRDFQAALDQARADVETASAAIQNLKAQIDLQHAVISQGQADLKSSLAAEQYAGADEARYQKLMKTGFGTVQRAELAQATLQEKTANVSHARAALLAADKKIAVLASAVAQANAVRDRALATERQAELNLSYTRVVAPVDGTVGARSLRVGQYVQAGTQLMAIVPMDAVYIVANFKETQLAHVRAGQPVEIKVDGYPDVELHGHVDSLSPASGLEFSLLPPDNATGNFTKIVQRIPVKIVLDEGNGQGFLRSGMSAEPVIDTKANAARVQS